MAKKAEKTPTQEARMPNEAEYLRYRKRMKAAKAEQDEAKGRMGSAKERAIAEYNLHSDADRIASKYLNKSPAQAAEFILHLTTYWEYLKLGEPGADMLETPAERKGRIKKGLKKGQTVEQAEEEVEELVPTGPAETTGRGDRGIRGGQVVDMPERRQEAG